MRKERQQLLIRELEHRAKNLFAVILSIVNRTLIEGQTIAEAKEVLVGRLNALAQAHALLAEAAWQGAPLAEIIQRVFAGLIQSRPLGVRYREQKRPHADGAWPGPMLHNGELIFAIVIINVPMPRLLLFFRLRRFAC
jgi:two-component sensor histidine kinase